jgi:hypothetical protein
MEEMPSPNMPFQRLKVAILPLDLPCCGPVTHSGDISVTGKKPDGSSKDDMEMKKTSRFKHATLNIKGLGEKEEELDKTLNENNITISVIMGGGGGELQDTKDTEKCTVMYNGINRYTGGQSGVIIWIHKSI